MPNLQRILPLSLFLAAIASLSTTTYARPVAVASDQSAAEAVTHVETWIKAHPKDPAGYRTLAHVHALAWAYGDTIPLVGTPARDALPRFTEDSTVLVSHTAPRLQLWVTKTILLEDRPVTADEAKHLAAAIAAYRKAIELDANDALSELALAGLLVQQGLYARELPLDHFGELKPTDTEKATRSQAIEQLASEDPKVRDAASKTLLAAMPKSLPLLRDKKAEDPEVKARIDAILLGHFELQALDHFRKAFALRSEADLKTDPTYQADSQISAKAGTHILTILAHHPEAAKKDEFQSIQEVLTPLAEKHQTLMSLPQ